MSGSYIRMCLYNYALEELETRLDIDLAIESLKLDKLSLNIINLMKEQYSYLEISRALNISHDIVNAKQRKVCDKLSKLLPEYSDAIIFARTAQILKRDLSETEMEFINQILIRCRAKKYSKHLTIFSYS